MANPDRPHGLYPLSKRGTEAVANNYQTDTGEATTMGVGDLVDIDSDGLIGRAAAGATAIVGVFKGCRYTDAAGKLVYSTFKPASVAAECEVYDDPDQEFIIQVDDDGATAVAQTLIGNNANHLDTAPSQLGPGGRSNQELDASGLATTPDTLKVKRLYEEVGMVFSTTEADSRFGWVVVGIAEHFWAHNYTTAGTVQTVPVPGV